MDYLEEHFRATPEGLANKRIRANWPFPDPPKKELPPVKDGRIVRPRNLFAEHTRLAKDAPIRVK